MFDIKLDLVRDFENCVLNDIKNAENDGFSFEDYNEWEKEEIIKINKEIDNFRNLGLDTKDIKKRLDTKALKEAYEKHLIYTYSALRERIIPIKPRKISYVKDFNRIPEYEDGLVFLEKKILSGENLLPHMSRQIFDTSSKDGLLYDFGIQHLHLGLKPDPKHLKLIEGREKVLYCVVDDENVYFLVIDNHGHWGDIELVRLIKNNFPHLIKPFELNIHSLSAHLTEEERIKLRKNGINTPIEVDGKCYMSPGWGVNTAGTSTNAVIKMDRYYQYYRNVEMNFKQFINDNIDSFRNILKEENKYNFVAQSISPIILLDKDNNVKIYLELMGDQIINIGIEC